MKINFIRLHLIFMIVLVSIGLAAVYEITNRLSKEADIANFLKRKAEIVSEVSSWGTLYLLNSQSIEDRKSLTGVVGKNVDVVYVFDEGNEVVAYNTRYDLEILTGGEPANIINLSDQMLHSRGYAMYPIVIDRLANTISDYEDEIFSNIRPALNMISNEPIGHILVHIKQDQLASEYLERRRILYYGVAIAVMVLMSLMLVDFFIGKPIRNLDKRLAAITNYDDYNAIDLDRIILKEVHNLACNFIQQHKSVMENNEQLEAVVNERTRELESLTKWLREHAFKSSRETDDAARRIAAEVHDVLGPKILTLKNNIDLNLTRYEKNSREYNEFQNTLVKIQQVNDTARSIIGRYRLSTTEYLGLEAGLDDVVEYVCGGEASLTRAEFTNRSLMLRDIDPRSHAEIIKIVQEALINAVRHSEATAIDVIASDSERGVVLVVKDNGKGFQESRCLDSHGISIMRERALYIDGSFSLESGPTGTEIRIVISV